MPTIKRISVTVGGMISVGGYENTKREVRIEADLKPDEDVTQVHTMLSAQAAELLANDVRLLVERQIEPKTINGDDALWVARHVSNRPSFPFLALLSPATAAVLVNDMVKLYASDAEEYVDPDEPQDLPFSDLPDDADGVDEAAAEEGEQPVNVGNWHGSHDPAGTSARGWDG